MNIRKELKLILRLYGIKQEDLYYRVGWHFNEVNKELLDDLKRQLGVNAWDMERIKRRDNSML